MNIKQIVKEVFSNIKKDWYLPVTEHQVYSEQEQVVGVWMGKPLYRKVVYLQDNLPSNSTDSVIYTENDAETLYIEKGMTTTGITLPYVVPQDISYGVGIYVNGNKVYVNTKMNRSTLGKPILCICYTKTIDTPTTKKVPFEPLIEYSTDEKMIGYWVDGKPVYRKTLTNVPLGTVVATDVDTLVNVNNVGSYNGSLFSWGGGNALNSWLNLEKSGSQYTLVANSPTSYVYGDVGILTIEYTKTTD